MRHIFTNICTNTGCKVVRGLISAIFFLAIVSVLQGAPAKPAGNASSGKAAAAKSESAKPAARKEAETEVPQAQTADQENEAESDPDMPTFAHGNIKVGIDEETYLKLRAEHIMRLRGLSDPSKVDPHARGNA